MPTPVITLIRFARAYAAERLPWFAPALYAAKIHLTEKVPVAAIDPSLNVYFNPKRIAALRDSVPRRKALAQIGFLWIHEISHVLREHAERAAEGGYDPRIWNIATDMEINDSDWEGLEPPTLYPGVFPANYKMLPGQLAETYYKALTSKKESKLEKGLSQSAKQLQDLIKGESEGEGGDAENDDETTNSHKDGQEASNQNGKSGDSADAADASTSDFEKMTDLLDEGSGVHNIPRPWEINADTREGRQEMDAVQAEQVRVSVAKEMEQAMRMGTLPAGWKRWVKQKLNPVVDWKKVLRHRVSRAINHSIGARIDYSFARPSRRQAVYDPLLPPALSGNLTGQIACVVDTSGSIGEQQLERILSEACGIFEVFRTPVTLIPCDAVTYEPIRLTSSTNFKAIAQMPGGGGTNMIRGIEAALALKPAPDVVVVLTDGYTPYPKQLYKTPVLFGILMYDLNATGMLPGKPWREDLVVKIPVGTLNP